MNVAVPAGTIVESRFPRSSLRAWVIWPEGVHCQIELGDADGLLVAAGYLGQVQIDCLRIRYNDRPCTMVAGHLRDTKGLPYNGIATAAYREARVPGTAILIRGPVVIFERVLL